MCPSCRANVDSQSLCIAAKLTKLSFYKSLATDRQEREKQLSEEPDVEAIVTGIKKQVVAFRSGLKRGALPFATSGDDNGVHL